jgi:hypothetical protein
MSTESIGKKGPPTSPPSGDVQASASSREAAPAFEVPGAAPAPATAPPTAAVGAPRAALERLRAGEIDVHGYVDVKVHEATAHLAALPPAELERLRSALRDRLAGDPGLVELVRKATGAVPQPQSDD